MTSLINKYSKLITNGGSILVSVYNIIMFDNSVTRNLNIAGILIALVSILNDDSDLDFLLNVLDITFTVYSLRLYKRLGMNEETKGTTISLAFSLVLNAVYLQN
jgi:hypothetical protein